MMQEAIEKLKASGWEWSLSYSTLGYHARAWREAEGKRQPIRCPICNTLLEHPAGRKRVLLMAHYPAPEAALAALLERMASEP